MGTRRLIVTTSRHQDICHESIRGAFHRTETGPAITAITFTESVARSRTYAFNAAAVLQFQKNVRVSFSLTSDLSNREDSAT